MIVKKKIYDRSTLALSVGLIFSRLETSTQISLSGWFRTVVKTSSMLIRRASLLWGQMTQEFKSTQLLRNLRAVLLLQLAK